MKIFIAAPALFVCIMMVLFSRADYQAASRAIPILPEDTTYRVFSLPNHLYGFDILTGKHVLIHQPFIPAVQGNRGFSTQTDAVKTARLMLHKLKNHEMPPTVSAAELDSLHIHIYP